MKTLWNFLAVGLGGALGCMLRYATTLLFTALNWSGNLSTLLVNILGSFAIGYFSSSIKGGTLLLLLTVGLCGGFTTFSTYSLQSLKLMQGGRMGAAILYITASVLLCILAAGLGSIIGSGGMPGRNERAIPQEGEVPVVKSDLKNLPEGDLYVWFGHSSFMLRLDGKIVLGDPALMSFSPVSFIGKAFPGTGIYKPEDLPEHIDYLLISHDHYDHLDKLTVKAIRDRVGKVVCPLGVGSILEKWDYAKENITELEWGGKWQDSLCFHCLPTRHFSGRGLKRNPTVQASYVVESKDRQVFYSGDGGYDDKRFKAIGAQFPELDLAIMENGQYDKQWSTIHTMPEHLVLEIQELSPARFVTVHHSKVCLSRHAWDEPRANEQHASQKSGVPVIVSKIGEIVKL